MRYRFGQVEVQVTERTVLLRGSPATLGARAFDVLLALIEHRDRVVGKDELLNLVWPGLVVEENNLAVQVSALRKLLGPQAIATLPGRGYRFAVALDAEPAVPSPAPAAAAPRGVLPAPPVPSASLLGREADLAALADLLGQSRLVTLVGAGGIGKTRLALALAHAHEGAHRDGVAWVDLAELDDPAAVPRAVSQAAGLPAVAGADALPALAEALRPLQMLLVLDNAEHLLAGVQSLAIAIAAKAPNVQVLVTSQAALKLDTERVFRLGPLSLPEPGASLQEAQAHGSVGLFVEQACAADRRFVLTDANVAEVIALCRQLDGVALAIKLAAARMPLLGLQGLSSRLGERLKLLAQGPRNAPLRQQTLEAALDWSYGLLDADAQAVFRRLSVFSGGFTLDLGAAVAADAAQDAWQVIDLLGELVDRSLVDVVGTTRLRYRMQETAREYARLKLDEAGEGERVRAWHAQAMAAAMDAAYESYWCTSDTPWLETFEPELDNLRSALVWSTRHDPQQAIRLAGASSVGFLLMGLAPEARRVFDALEPLADAAGAGPAAARFWLERARLEWGVSNSRMHEHALRAAELCRARGDVRGLYLALRCAAGSGVASADAAAAMLAELAALERPEWPPRLRSQRVLAEIGVAAAAGQHAQVRSASESLLGAARAARLDAVAAVAAVNLAAAQLALEQPQQAVQTLQALLAAPGARRGNLVLQALATLAHALLALDHAEAAQAAVADLIAASRSRAWEWFSLNADLFAWLAARQGRIEAAARLIGHADAGYRRAGPRGANPARARALAQAAIDAALEPESITRLMAEGERMDEEAVCALALADAEAACQPPN